MYRDVLVRQLESALRKHQPESDVVGYAYAIGDEIRGARWFEHHTLFNMHRANLLQGLALELLTCEQEAHAKGIPLKNANVPSPSAVDKFVNAIDSQAVSESRDTAGANVNEYKESRSAYGSRTMAKPMGKGSSPRKISSDYAKK